MLKTYDEAGTLLEAIDALQLPRGSWVATDADGTLWAADVADLAWHRLLSSRQARPHAAAVMARLLEKVGRTPSMRTRPRSTRSTSRTCSTTWPWSTP